MKVRWTKGSIRFRITPTELDALVRGQSIDERLDVPGGAWRVSIGIADTTAIGLSNGDLRVTLAPNDVDRLADAEAEGVYFTETAPSAIAYYIEKDFPCIHPRPAEANEQPSETFAPPVDFKQRHKTNCS